MRLRWFSPAHPCVIFCPSCHQKRALVFAERLVREICAQVPHRQFVFTIPKRFRGYFRYDRNLLGDFARCAWESPARILLDLPAPNIPRPPSGDPSYRSLTAWGNRFD